MERLHKDKLPLEHPFKIALKIYRDRLLLVLAAFLLALLISIVFGVAKAFPPVTAIIVFSSFLLFFMSKIPIIREVINIIIEFQTNTLIESRNIFSESARTTMLILQGGFYGLIEEKAKNTTNIKEVDDNNEVKIIKQMSSKKFREIMNLFEETKTNIANSRYLSLEEKKLFISQVNSLIQKLVEAKPQKGIIKKQEDIKLESE